MDTTTLKRFTDTAKWSDRNFRLLTPQAKLLWLWLRDNCDNAGVISPDLELAAFQIGQPIEEQHFKEIENKTEKLENGKIWMPDFVAFQFGELTENSRVHESVIKLLASHGIDYGNAISSHSIPIAKAIDSTKDKEKNKDQDKNKDKDKDKDKESKGNMSNGKPSLEEVVAFCVSLGLPANDGESFFHGKEGNGWKNGKSPVVNWKATIRNWKAISEKPSKDDSTTSAAPPRKRQNP